jgi:hypothetical protein
MTFDAATEKSFSEIFCANPEIKATLQEAIKTGSGFYRIDEELKITRIKTSDVFQLPELANGE